jgi:hypothetical protein
MQVVSMMRDECREGYAGKEMRRNEDDGWERVDIRPGGQERRGG